MQILSDLTSILVGYHPSLKLDNIYIRKIREGLLRIRLRGEIK